MTGPAPSQRQDWVIPAVLVAIAVVVGVVVTLFAVRASSGDDESVASQLETWSRCLRSEGAPLPLVESLSGGGFRITVDGTILEGDLDLSTVSDAMEACRDDVPERMRAFVDFFGLFDSLPFGGADFGDMNDLMGPRHEGLDDGVSPPPQLGQDFFNELCDRLDEHLGTSQRVPPRMLEACDLVG